MKVLSTISCILEESRDETFEVMSFESDGDSPLSSSYSNSGVGSVDVGKMINGKILFSLFEEGSARMFSKRGFEWPEIILIAFSSAVGVYVKYVSLLTFTLFVGNFGDFSFKFKNFLFETSLRLSVSCSTSYDWSIFNMFWLEALFW